MVGVALLFLDKSPTPVVRRAALIILRDLADASSRILQSRHRLTAGTTWDEVVAFLSGISCLH